ncbi:MAG TPA: DUF3489 domain-containing protein [Bryobacteraceae bacterium]|nr:DUF3489 domain-containing protein [Bryobacteraceae bacterium]
MTSTTEETNNARPTVAAGSPPPPRRSRKAAAPTRTAPRTKTPKTVSARKGSKTAKILALVKRPGGAALKELMKATGWQPHSVRGFLSGVLTKKMGLKVSSVKGASDERRYSVKA